jgi:ABC-2 type transport system ATP-binding protein
VAAVVETSALTVQFGATTALDAVDVEIGGGVTGLVGANGAGKTTLFSTLLGLLRPTAGAVSVLGLDPRRSGRELRASVGYGSERNVFPDDLRAYDFVRHLAEVRGLPRREARNRASDALWLVGLGEERFRPLGTMSTGQRQRVKLAQAVAADPRLMLLDEPTDGLDPVQRDEMLGLIRTISEEFSIDVVLSSHVLDEVERVCDAVVVLDGGRLVTSGRLTDLAARQSGLVVELVDLPDRPGTAEAVATLLRGRGMAVEAAGTLLTVESDDDAALDAVRDAVAEAGARLRSLGGRHRRLEDVFDEADRLGEPDSFAEPEPEPRPDAPPP